MLLLACTSPSDTGDTGPIDTYEHQWTNSPSSCAREPRCSRP